MIKIGVSFVVDISKRQKLYSQGGIISVTSRILVVDLLSSMDDPLVLCY